MTLFSTMWEFAKRHQYALAGVVALLSAIISLFLWSELAMLLFIIFAISSLILWLAIWVVFSILLYYASKIPYAILSFLLLIGGFCLTILLLSTFIRNTDSFIRGFFGAPSYYRSGRLQTNIFTDKCIYIGDRSDTWLYKPGCEISFDEMVDVAYKANDYFVAKKIYTAGPRSRLVPTVCNNWCSDIVGVEYYSYSGVRPPAMTPDEKLKETKRETCFQQYKCDSYGIKETQ